MFLSTNAYDEDYVPKHWHHKGLPPTVVTEEEIPGIKLVGSHVAARCAKPGSGSSYARCSTQDVRHRRI